MKVTYALHLYKGYSPMGFNLPRVRAINTIIPKKKTMQNHACMYKEVTVEGFVSSSKVVLCKAYCG